jgi:hypothetical protein
MEADSLDGTRPSHSALVEANRGRACRAAKGWLFEPKYDGFRCFAFRDGDTINMQSKKLLDGIMAKPLGQPYRKLSGETMTVETVPLWRTPPKPRPTGKANP